MKTDKTVRFCLTGILSLALILPVYGATVFADPEGQPQRLCPILGGEIDKSVYVDYAGKRVYFCCRGCTKTFLENPDKYIRDMESQGISLEKTPQADTGAMHRHQGGPGGSHSGMGHRDPRMKSGGMMR